jgi:hypothetical protein
MVNGTEQAKGFMNGPGGDTHLGLPVAGYRPQTSDKVETVNANKETEEQVLRILDGLAGRPEVDKRWLAIGRTHIETGFMAVNRAVFQPGRASLPGDVPALAAETVADTASQDLRSRGEPRIPRREEALPNGRPHP